MVINLDCIPFNSKQQPEGEFTGLLLFQYAHLHTWQVCLTSTFLSSQLPSCLTAEIISVTTRSREQTEKISGVHLGKTCAFFLCVSRSFFMVKSQRNE